jgi:hypothetical protein
LQGLFAKEDEEIAAAFVNARRRTIHHLEAALD